MPDASAVALSLRPKVLEPGLAALDPGVERYVVRGGGAIAIALEAGDTLEVIRHNKMRMHSEGLRRSQLSLSDLLAHIP